VAQVLPDRKSLLLKYFMARSFITKTRLETTSKTKINKRGTFYECLSPDKLIESYQTDLNATAEARVGYVCPNRSHQLLCFI
jgi:hypothetical protein